MSSMCGIVDFEKKSVDFSVLHKMGRSMVLRGQDQSGAYLKGGVGLYHNRMLCGEAERARQPYTVERNGRLYTVMTDGVLQGSTDRLFQFSLFDFESAAEAILEAYLSFGLAFAPYVQGSFAFAICDEYRGEMLLGRSADGKCPLYYTYADGRLCFASEIKGMLRGIGGSLTVNTVALRRHLFSPFGTDGVGIYESFFEVAPGQCLVFSRMDVHEFPLPKANEEDGESERGEIFVPDAPLSMTESLDVALAAFDYPQFDAEMPAYLKVLCEARAKNKRAVRVLDGARAEDLFYARKREDRLGGFYGLSVYGVTPTEKKREPKSWRESERLLDERLSACDARVLSDLYGPGVLEAVKAERSRAQRIRQKGMLCQTDAWLARYPILSTHGAMA